MEWTLWMTLVNSKMSNQLAVEDYTTFPINRRLFQTVVECWAATKACDLIHGIRLVQRETFFLQSIQSTQCRHLTDECCTLGILKLHSVTQCSQVQGDLQGEDRKKWDTIPTPRFARRPSTRNSLFSQQRRIFIESYSWSTKTSDLGTSFWHISHTFNILMLEDQNQNRSMSLFWFPNFEMLDARIASALNKIIQNSYSKTKVSLEEQNAQKEDRFLRGRQIAYMICDDFQVTGAHETVIDCADPFTITLRNDGNLIRYWTKFYHRWQESHLMTSWKACTNWEYVSLINPKPYWNCMTLKFVKRYRSPIIKDGKNGEEKHR